MENRIFDNVAYLTGDYMAVPFQNTVSSPVSVRMAEITFEKWADQSLWLSGFLTLRFTIDNTTGEGPLETLIITDILDSTKFSFVADSLVLELTDDQGVKTVLVDGEDYTFSVAPVTEGDLLTVNLLEDGLAEVIDVGMILTITFQGSKVDP